MPFGKKGGSTKHFIVTLLSVVFFCEVIWVKPKVDYNSKLQDLRDCREYAKKKREKLGSGVPASILADTQRFYFIECMEGKGYKQYVDCE